MKLVLSRLNASDKGFVLNGDVLVEVIDLNKEPELSVGTVLVGRIRDVRPAIGGAFVRISAAKASEDGPNYGFLPFSDIPSDYEVKPEKQILVQIVSLPSGTKPYKLTAKPTLAGVFTVFGMGRGQLQISRKLTEEARQRIRECAIDMVPADRSVTIRTNAGELKEEEFAQTVRREIDELQRIYEDMIHKAASRTDYTVLYRPEGTLSSFVRNRRPEEVIVDFPSGISPETYIKELGDINPRIYQDTSGAMYRTVFGIDRQIREMKSRKVYLKSGAYIVIDHTEALVAIDVNSGKNSELLKGAYQRDKASEAALRVNMEAAAEIFRQIRLRNLSGMILIDFINMNDACREMLRDELHRLCRQDPVPMKFVDFTGLGLAEITRKKTGEPLDLIDTVLPV